MKKITYASLREADAPIRLGDVSYFYPESPSPVQMGQFVRWISDQKWFEPIAKKIRIELPVSKGMGFFVLEILISEICTEGLILRSKKREPEWMALLPNFARYYVRRGHMLGEGADPLAIVRSFPYMGFGYLIHEDGLAREACEIFNLFRLSGVRQLAFLHDPVLREGDRTAGAIMFDHTRYCHVLDTYAVSRLIAHNCNLNEIETNTLIVAAISHDALTPAGGDTTKLVDPPAFDEDANFPDLLKGERWEAFREKWKLDENLLCETILGKGKLGKLLDVCDKSSYISRDCHRYLGCVVPQKNNGSSSSHFAISCLVRENPLLTKLWDEVYIRDGQVVIQNAERLHSFLKARAFMFRELYYNPYSRFFEYLVGRGVTKYLYETGAITRQDLLTEVDSWLEHKIDQFFGVRYMMAGLSQLDNARIEEHSDLDAAFARASEFDNDENTLVVVDEFAYGSGSSTKKYFVSYEGRLMPFSEAYVDETSQIDNLMKFNKFVKVYFFSCDDLGIPHERRPYVKKIFKQKTQSSKTRAEISGALVPS